MARAAEKNGALGEAESRFRRGDLGKAEALFAEALRKSPGDPAALVGLARTAFLRGDAKGAEELLARAEKAAPDRAETIVTRGVIVEQGGDWRRAFELFRAAAKSDPRCFNARFNHARLLAKAERWSEAADEYAAALALDPASEPAKAQKNLAAARRAALEAGLATLRRAIGMNPTFVEAYESLADALLKLDRDGEAASLLATANLRFPARRGILERLATVFQRQMQLGLARDVTREIAKLAPEEAGVRRRLALLELAAGEPARAEAAAKKATALAPADPEMPFALGVIYESARAFEPAKAAYRRAAELDPRHWSALVNLGRLLATEKKQGPALDEAVKILEKARSLAPAEPAPALNLALALEAKGDRARAIEAASAVLGMRAPEDLKAQARRTIARLSDAKR